jgi:sporulation protein YlmC with PRC-barrel domain
MSTILSSDSLIGNEVRNFQGENLGEIRDFMIDSTNGRVEYAVLDFGGFMNIGNKLFAVPMQALQLDTENQVYKINQPKGRLEHAEGFDKDNWPDMADPKWRANINSFYIN